MIALDVGTMLAALSLEAAAAIWSLQRESFVAACCDLLLSESAS